MYQRVVVTVKRKDEARVRDLEVPVNIDASRLAEMIARALRWESDMAGQRITYLIEAHPLGRMLQPDETLAGAGVWDGSWLVLHPVAPPGAPQTGPLVMPGAEANAVNAEAQPAGTPAPGQAEPEPLVSANLTELQAKPQNIPTDDPWTFPVAAVPAPQPEVESQSAEPDEGSLLEMLLGGDAVPPDVQPEMETPLPARGPETEDLPWNFPVDETPATASEPVVAQQAATTAEAWNLPSDGEQVQPLLDPMPPIEAAPQPATLPAEKIDAWSFLLPVTPAPATSEPEAEQEVTPASDEWSRPSMPATEPHQEVEASATPSTGASLLEMLLGSTAPPSPTEQAGAPPGEGAAPAWNFDAEPAAEPALADNSTQQAAAPDTWTFPELQPEQLPEPEPAITARNEPWAQPVADRPELEPQAVSDTQQAPAGDSLLEMLLGGQTPSADPATSEPPSSVLSAPPPTLPPPTLPQDDPIPQPSLPDSQPEPAQTAQTQPVPATATDEAPPATSGTGGLLSEPKVGGFRSLGIDLPPASTPEVEEKKPGKFVWKKLDD